MKTIITIILIISGLSVKPAFGQANSSITYDAGTSINILSGADECADNIIINGTYSGSGTICMGALPVTLSSFTSSVKSNNATLMWVTEAEINNSGFDIERAGITTGGPGEWKKIAFVQGHGTSNVSNGYMYKDEKLKAGTYKYRLKQIDFNSNYEYFELSADVSIQPPGKFEMSQNYPNPSNPKCRINFEIPISGRINMRVYDITGKEVITLLDETREADYYTVEFDGSNLSSGVYFYRIYAEGEGQKFTKTMKMVLVK